MLISFTKGFSLIELMIVLAITTILGMLAVPSYQEYVTRAKVVNMLTMAQPAKLAVSEAVISGNIAVIEKMTDQDAIKEMTVADNIISIIANSEKLGLAKDKILKITLRPVTNQHNIIQWKCSAEPSDLKKFLPTECRN